jgi:hypothetical protein
MGNRSWLVVMLRFARCCPFWGPWFQTGGIVVKKIMSATFEVGYLSSVWAFQRKLFFSRYIAGCLVGVDRLVVDFWVDSEGLKIEMWETLKKVEKSTHCARTVCCCMNFENVDFFLNVVHVYQLAGHLVSGDIPLSHRKKNRRRYEKVCKSWMKIRTQIDTSRLGMEK